MAKIIPVPVDVRLGVPGGLHGTDDKDPRFFGTFSIVPYATARNGSLEVERWMVLDRNGYSDELNDILLFSVMPKKLLDHVCVSTFETEKPWINLIVDIDDERWFFPIRARELEHEQVHYEVDVDGEWMLLPNMYVGDVLSEEQFLFAERAVLPSIDFGSQEAVLNEMH